MFYKNGQPYHLGDGDRIKFVYHRKNRPGSMTCWSADGTQLSFSKDESDTSSNFLAQHKQGCIEFLSRIVQSMALDPPHIKLDFDEEEDTGESATFFFMKSEH